MRTGSGILALVFALQTLAAGPLRAEPAARSADFGSQIPSADARRVADWAVRSDDVAGSPFIVVDKVAARVFVFSADGTLKGAAPALLGLAVGDVSPPGIGDRPLAAIGPLDRITPAGRFEARMGRNLHDDILWLDYDAAISLHRVATGNVAEQRLRRLATSTVSDNRVSFGCINVPASFYEGIVSPAFAPKGGVVYVLPERLGLQEVFGVKVLSG